MPSLQNLGSSIKALITRLVRLLPNDDWLVIGWVAGFKVVLLIFGVRSYHLFENKALPEDIGWLDIWNQWDAIHFLRTAEFGYSATDTFKSWFYPLYPWSVRVAHYITGDYLVATFVVSSIASIVVAVVLRRMVRLDFSPEVSRAAVWFFLIFPTAYYLHIGYTEGLFFALAFACIFAARKERWMLSGILGAFAWMTRANGIVLLPTLAVEAGHQWFAIKRWRWQWLWIGIVPLGFAVYLWVNWRVTGDAFWFLKMRTKLFHMSFSWPWIGIREAYRNIHRNPNQAEIVGVEELLATLLALVCAIISWFKLRPSYATWITFNWILVASVTFIESMPRYALSMFPIFILFGLLGQNRFWSGIITFWSILFLAVFSSLFIRAWWVF